MTMDAECHELEVLEGALETTKTFKPRLALNVYHSGNVLVKLTELLLELNNSYNLYLRHYVPGWAETVLYAGRRASYVESRSDRSNLHNFRPQALPATSKYTQPLLCTQYLA